MPASVFLDAGPLGLARTAVGPVEAAVIAGHMRRFPGVDARDWDDVR